MSNPNPENPYVAPQLAQADLAPVVDPAELGPGELPCHACGQSVSEKVVKCLRCGVKPLYDRLELLITAALVFVAIMAVQLCVQFRNEDSENSWFFLTRTCQRRDLALGQMD